MSEVATYSVSIEADYSYAGSRTASAATPSAFARFQNWLEDVSEEFDRLSGEGDSLIEQIGAESAVIVPLCANLGLSDRPSALDIIEALEPLGQDEVARLLDTSIKELRIAQSKHLRSSLQEAVSGLGYRLRRSDRGAATFCHRKDGTTIRIATRISTDAIALDLDLSGFSDGRCRNVRAKIEDVLRRRGIKLKVVSRTGNALSSQSACAASKAGMRSRTS